MSTENADHILTGKYFHSYATDADGHVLVEWQGRILGPAHRSLYLYLVETYEWGCGDIHSTFLVPAIDMAAADPKPWTFYDTSEEMRDAYEHGPASAYSIKNRRPVSSGVGVVKLVQK